MGFGGFSWKRAAGISSAKAKISKSIGIPLTKGGRQRKLGAFLGGNLLGAVVPASSKKTSTTNDSSSGCVGCGCLSLLIFMVYMFFSIGSNTDNKKSEITTPRTNTSYASNSISSHSQTTLQPNKQVNSKASALTPTNVTPTKTAITSNEPEHSVTVPLATKETIDSPNIKVELSFPDKAENIKNTSAADILSLLNDVVRQPTKAEGVRVTLQKIKLDIDNRCEPLVDKWGKDSVAYFSEKIKLLISGIDGKIVSRINEKEIEKLKIKTIEFLSKISQPEPSQTP